MDSSLASPTAKVLRMLEILQNRPGIVLRACVVRTPDQFASTEVRVGPTSRVTRVYQLTGKLRWQDGSQPFTAVASGAPAEGAVNGTRTRRRSSADTAGYFGGQMPQPHAKSSRPLTAG